MCSMQLPDVCYVTCLRLILVYVLLECFPVLDIRWGSQNKLYCITYMAAKHVGSIYVHMTCILVYYIDIF